MNQQSYTIKIARHGRILVHIQDFPLADNHITFLFGESGIGKSLIAKAIYGLLSPDEFDIEINGEEYAKYFRNNRLIKIQKNSFFSFQEPSTHLNPLMMLDEQLKEGSLHNRPSLHRVLSRFWNSDELEKMESILQVYPKPYRPSGGEKQRILLAMSFLRIENYLTQHHFDEDTLFIFDEPGGSLDDHSRNIFLSYLVDVFRRHPFTVLLITHDYSTISAVQHLATTLQDKILYKELTFQEGRLRCVEFKPETYLQWLHVQVPSRTFHEKKQTKRILLQVENRVDVFDRRLELFHDGQGEHPCNLEILPSSIVYLKAPSGTGKTTFAKALMGLTETQHLRMKLKTLVMDERTPREFWKQKIWGKHMTMVFQHADEALNQQSTVEGALTGLPSHRPFHEVQQLIGELFESEYGGSFLRTRIQYLSGGQKQKLNLIRSILLDTEILILDEPLNGLDFRSIARVIKLLQKKREEGKGLLLISHNEEIFDRLVLKENIYYLQSLPA